MFRESVTESPNIEEERDEDDEKGVEVELLGESWACFFWHVAPMKPDLHCCCEVAITEPSEDVSPKKMRNFSRVFWLSLLSISISLFFFLWALYNTLHTDYQDGLILSSCVDDGLLCFPFTMCSGFLSLFTLYYHSVLSYSYLICFFILFSYSFTVSVFLAAAIDLNSPPLHRSYLILSAMIWGSYGIFFYREMNIFRIEKLIELSNPLLSNEKVESQMIKRENGQ
jgi:hypothetical protein